MTKLFDNLHADHDDPAETRVDQGDLLPAEDRCSFLSIDTDPDSEPCAHHADGDRLIEQVLFPACTHHRHRGGILHRDAKRKLVLELRERQVLEHTHATTADGEKVTYPRFCSSCGRGLFTGNTTGKCSECQPESELSAAERIAEHTGHDEWLAESDRQTAEDIVIEHHDGSWRDR